MKQKNKYKYKMKTIKITPPHLESFQIRRAVIIITMLFFSNIGFAQWSLSGNSVSSSDFIGTTNNADLFFYTNNRKRMTLTPDNGYLILNPNGSSSPTGIQPTIFTLVDKGEPVFITILNNPTTIPSVPGVLKIGLNADGPNAIINQVENANLSFFTYNSERLTILGDGKIGIGTNAPTALLDVNGSLRFRNGATNNYVLKSDANGNATWQALNDDNPTNEIQDLSLTGNTLSLSNDATTVDLSAYIDNTDEQNLSISGHDLTIDNGNTITLPDNVDDADADTTNELISSATLNGNNLEITDAGGTKTVDLSSFDNSTMNINDADADPTNELQNLSVNNGNLEISDGNAIPLSDLSASIWSKNQNNDAYYNTGKVGIGLTTPASNLHLHNSNPNQNNPNKGVDPGNGNVDIGPDLSYYLKSTFQLTNTNTGINKTDGLYIQSNNFDAIFNLQESGNMNFITNNHTGFYLNNSGNTGIGIETPQSTLHIHNSTESGGGNIGIGTGVVGKSGETTDETASTIQLTNLSTGSGENNGLFISAYSKSGIINLNEAGYFDIKMQDESALRINSNKKIRLSSLEGSGERIVTVSSYGELRANTSLDDLSVWRKNGNVAYYDNGNVGIGVNTTSFKLDVNGRLKVRGSDFVFGTDDGREQGIKLKNRALVHAGDDALIINYNGDFEGGTIIKENLKIEKEGQFLTFSASNGGCPVPNVGESVEIGSSTGAIVFYTGGVGYNTLVANRFWAIDEFAVSPSGSYPWPDYVFDENYKLISLNELDKFIKKNNHLPEIPTTADVEKDGIQLGKMNVKLLKKVEELTLYTIEQQKMIDKQNIQSLEQKELIETLIIRIEKIENKK